MSLYIRPNGERCVDLGPVSPGERKRLRAAARGKRGTDRARNAQQPRADAPERDQEGLTE